MKYHKCNKCICSECQRNDSCEYSRCSDCDPEEELEFVFCCRDAIPRDRKKIARFRYGNQKKTQGNPEDYAKETADAIL